MKICKIQELIPHSGEMVLLDDWVEKGKDFICVKVTIKNDNPFLQNGVFPTFKILEMMAQSLVVFRGLNNHDSSFDLGFLLGTRGFEIFKPSLFVGDEILIKTHISEDYEGVGVHYSEAFVRDDRVAKANISVFNPSKEQLRGILEDRNG